MFSAVSALCVVLLTSGTPGYADPAPGTPGNSGNQNPNGAPPGQGGPVPGNSGSNNPHVTPPGQRIPPGGAPGPSENAPGASGGAPATAPGVPRLPGATAADTAAVDARTHRAGLESGALIWEALGPEGPGPEDAWISTVDRELHYSDGRLEHQRTRRLGRRGAARTEMVIPRGHCVVGDQGRFFWWTNGTGWEVVPPAFPQSALVTGPPAGDRGSGPTVRATTRVGTHPHEVIITEPLGPGSAREWTIDRRADVVTGSRQFGPGDRVLWEERRVEERRGNRRWIRWREVIDRTGHSPSLVERWTWQTGAGVVTDFELWAPPAP